MYTQKKMEIAIPEKKNRSGDCVVIKRGDIFYADLRPVVGSEQGGASDPGSYRMMSANHSPTVICAAITSKMNKAKLPTHIEIDASAYMESKGFYNLAGTAAYH